jgi:GDP-4-dehydro-6-deoxy-D-mannose reductase
MVAERLEGRASRRGRTLVTGAGGFVAGWLVPRLRAAGEEVIEARGPAVPETPDLHDSVLVDFRDREAVVALLRDVRPQRIVHLAAVSFPPDAERDPVEAMHVNYGGVDSLLEGMRRYTPEARLLYVGTGAVYGAAPPERPPFEEKDPLQPDSLYAATKAAAEQRCVLAVEREGLDVVRARPFNHTGPGRPPSYVESSFARQLARIERGQAERVLRVGNLEARRDFSDVRDVVRAYEVLLDRGERGAAYNVCSGEGRSIQELLGSLLELTSTRPAVERDPSLYRPAPRDRLSLVGNPTRLRALGFAPRYGLRATLADLLDYWREQA